MRRLGIFVFYDKSGIVDGYVEYIITQLNKVLDDLIIVVNGDINEAGECILKNYSTQFYKRDNTGLDAGAYADVIVNLLGEEKLSQYDELVLCNDTFYGPFVSFEEIFTSMKNEKYDFWGIDGIKRNFLSYIVMYFCVFRGKLLKNGDLFNYFKSNVLFKVNEMADAFALLQVGLYYTLTQKGYKPGLYTYSNGYQSKRNPDICVLEYNLPIWKKKFFLKDNYTDEICDKLVAHLESKKLYDTSLMKQNVKRVYGVEIGSEKKKFIGTDNVNQPEIKYSVPQITYDDINHFVSNHRQIYIYGAGSFARATAFVFLDKIEDFYGFIVSDEKNIKDRDIWGYPVIQASQVPPNSSIIVALNYEHSVEVLSWLGKNEHFFYFWDLK
ncbi:rhamnan synthesis F family protein [Paenibacillus polysaccharolyticus]|uniref:rhamnan synthesis F family protein n=1 Tax=Paenibacillus polysaccharolyticus TaxID=582692 RepID=UPI00280B4A8C|nr:rhamnan synthesis F family protein [Paenibacillus polysaccharolyticus]